MPQLKIQLQYSILPEFTELQPTVQQLKIKPAQQFYNFKILTILIMRIYMLYLKFLYNILYCTSSKLITILNLRVHSTSTLVIRVLITWNSKLTPDNTAIAGTNYKEK
jgi:vesicle coat complex subunit